MGRPLKPAKTFTEQLAILEERGMLVDDADEAIRWLEQTNYYRLTGYAFQFLNAQGTKYKGSISFDLMTKLHRFDQELRHRLIMALEPAEIFARTQIAYHFAHAHGRQGGAHYDSSNFQNPQYHAEFLGTLDSQMDKNKHAAFVNHHICKYDGKMPVWCAVEILPFSALSKLYSNMLETDRETIAKGMGLDAKYVGNWLHCFSVLRNTCAHYGRLYCAICSPPARLGGKTLRRYPQVHDDSLFAYIIALLRFLPRREQKDDLRDSITDVVKAVLPYIDLGLLGFPDDWDTILYTPDIVAE